MDLLVYIIRLVASFYCVLFCLVLYCIVLYCIVLYSTINYEWILCTTLRGEVYMQVEDIVGLEVGVVGPCLIFLLLIVVL